MFYLADLMDAVRPMARWTPWVLTLVCSSLEGVPGRCQYIVQLGLHCQGLRAVLQSSRATVVTSSIDEDGGVPKVREVMVGPAIVTRRGGQ